MLIIKFLFIFTYMKFLILLVIIISNFNLIKSITKNKFLILVQTFLVLYFTINKKKMLLLCSKLYFKNSNYIDLKNYKSFDEFLKNNLNSKRRNDIKKDIKNLNEFKIIKSELNINHLYYLYKFLIRKFKNPILINFNFLLSLFVISTFKLKYFNFYDSNNNLLGWSSYFIDDDIYYDFLSSPNEIHISHILINSLKYCLNNKITKIDIGPTHDDIKKRKFNSDKYIINTSFLDLLN